MVDMCEIDEMRSRKENAYECAPEMCKTCGHLGLNDDNCHACEDEGSLFDGYETAGGN